MAMHGKSILVTGAAGFLGREVLKQLQKRKALEPGIDRIIAIDNYDPLCGSQNLFPDIFGDIAMLPTVKWTHVIHLAAIGRNLTCEHNPYHAFKTNVGGTLNVLERAREQGAKVLFCSSNIVLSEYDSVYRMTKRTAEELCRVYARHGLDVMILRPSNIAGPGQSRTEFQPCCFAAMDKCFSAMDAAFKKVFDKKLWR